MHQFELGELKFNIIDEAVSVNTITAITAALTIIIAITIITAIIIDAYAIGTVATAIINATAIIVIVIITVASIMAAGIFALNAITTQVDIAITRIEATTMTITIVAHSLMTIIAMRMHYLHYV